jgi:hypothetical protein|tara:strand:+ start:395 stop:568 length:174 start_codon:yes stop_codon:yes gene_type:complete
MEYLYLYQPIPTSEPTSDKSYKDISITYRLSEEGASEGAYDGGMVIVDIGGMEWMDV